MSVFLGASVGVAIFLAPHVVLAAATTAVTIRVTSEREIPLIERIRGQLSDLDVTLQTTSSTPLEPSLAERVSGASAVGRSTSADIVVWFERVDTSLRVYVLSVDSGDVLVRSVNAGPSASTSTGDLRTSTLETVALVVRDAIAAWRKTEHTPPPPPTASATKTPGASAGPRAEPAHERLVPPGLAPPSWRVRSSLGWLAIASGSRSTFQGLVLGAGLVRGRFGAGVTASTSLPNEVEDGPVRLRLRRTAATLHAFYRLPMSEHLWLDGLAGGGVAVFSRSTEVLRGGATAAPGNHAVSPLLMGELILTVSPWSSGPTRGVGVFLSVGLDYAFRPPSYDYATEGGLESGPSIVPFQPKFSIGIAWEIAFAKTSSNFEPGSAASELLSVRGSSVPGLAGPFR